MSCEFCTDPDGAACFPIYGVGPHRHVGVTDDPSSILGSTEHLPQSEWPTNYRENPDEPGSGIWWCPHCGDGKPEDAPLGVPIAPDWREHLEKLSKEAEEWQKQKDASEVKGDGNE